MKTHLENAKICKLTRKFSQRLLLCLRCNIPHVLLRRTECDHSGAKRHQRSIAAIHQSSCIPECSVWPSSDVTSEQAAASDRPTPWTGPFSPYQRWPWNSIRWSHTPLHKRVRVHAHTHTHTLQLASIDARQPLCLWLAQALVFGITVIQNRSWHYSYENPKNSADCLVCWVIQSSRRRPAAGWAWPASRVPQDFVPTTLLRHHSSV